MYIFKDCRSFRGRISMGRRFFKVCVKMFRICSLFREFRFSRLFSRGGGKDFHQVCFRGVRKKLSGLVKIIHRYFQGEVNFKVNIF